MRDIASNRIILIHEIETVLTTRSWGPEARPAHRQGVGSVHNSAFTLAESFMGCNGLDNYSGSATTNTPVKFL